MNNSPSRDVTNPKTAYLFPGQGSQQVGMGKDLYENSPVARRIFDEADNPAEGKMKEAQAIYNFCEVKGKGPRWQKGHDTWAGA